jgi:hypothetical protein
MAIGIGIGLSPSFGGGGGSGVSYTAEAEALFARMSAAPDATRKGLINTAILSLLTGAVSGSNIWAKLDALYLIAAHNQQAADLNWKSAGYTLSPLGGMGAGDFTTDRGYLGDGIGKYLATGITPSAGGFNYALDSACFGAWINVDNVSVNSCMGSVSGSNVRLNPNASGSARRRDCGSSRPTAPRQPPASYIETGQASRHRSRLRLRSRPRTCPFFAPRRPTRATASARHLLGDR